MHSDYKALEALNTKGNINSSRIKRWIERIQVYDFKIKYMKPENLQHVDALSRSYNLVNQVENEELSQIIIRIHEEIVHREAKATYEEIKRRGYIEIKLIQVRNVLSRCFRCKQYNPVQIEGFNHV